MQIALLSPLSLIVPSLTLACSWLLLYNSNKCNTISIFALWIFNLHNVRLSRCISTRQLLTPSQFRERRLKRFKSVSFLQKFTPETVFVNRSVSGLFPEAHLSSNNSPENISGISLSPGSFSPPLKQTSSGCVIGQDLHDVNNFGASNW